MQQTSTHAPAYEPPGRSGTSGARATAHARSLARRIRDRLACAGASGPRADRRLYWSILFFYLLTLALVWAGTAGVVASDRDRTIAGAVRENENLARAFEEHIASIVGGLDELAQIVQLQYEDSGPRLDLGRLLSRVSALKAVANQIAILDERGVVVLASSLRTGLDLSDREYFQVHADHDSGRIFVSKPILGRVSGKWLLQLTRRINKRDGGFGGVVVVAFDPYYLARFYEQVDLGSGGVTTLVGLDGVVRARQAGEHFTLGHDVRESTLFRQIAQRRHGTFLEPSFVDGVPRFTSYRTMKEHPFVVVVGTSKADVLANFHGRRTQLLFAALAMTVLLAAAAAWLAILVRRQSRYAAELHESRARQQAFMDSVPDIGWMKDRSGRFIAVNGAFAARFGVATDAVIGKTDAEVFGAEAAYRSQEEDGRVMRFGKTLRLETTVRHDGATCWLETIKTPVYDVDGAVKGISGVARDITERKRAELALSESERRLKLALEAADVALFDWDILTGEVFISERWSVFLGGAPQATRTTLRALSDMVHPDDRAHVDRKVVQALRADVGFYRAEHRVRADVGWIWIESQGSVVARDEKGRALRMLGINAHITQRKYIDNALRRSEERFRNLIELSSDWYWEQDERLRFSLFSGGFTERTGMRAEDYLGRTRWELPARGITEQQWAEHRAALERHEPFHEFEMERVDPAGQLHYWSISGRPVFDATGRFTGYQGIGRDITRRKAAEVAMREAHAFLDSVVENIPAMVFVKDAEALRFVRVNRAAEEMIGYTREQVIGNSDRDLFPPEQAEHFIRVDRETLAHGKLVEIPEERLATATSHVRYLRTRKIPIYDDGGRPRFLLGIAEDITGGKHAAEKMQEMNRLLEQRAAELTAANGELEAFGYTVSHDLRAPLRHISGFVKLLRERLAGHPDAQAMRLFDKVASAAAHMSELIDDLLAFSRMSRSKLQKSAVMLDALVADVLEELRPDALNRRIDWRIGPLPEVHADRNLLHLAFSNLIGNAVKYTATRAVAAIEIGCLEQRDGRCVIFVRDNGVGFDAKHAERLFGVFQRLHPAHEFEGTGIGLANVKRIVERHGGSVWAVAERDKGATFFMALPTGEEQG